MYFIAQATTQTTQAAFNEGNIMGSDVKIRLKTVRGAVKRASKVEWPKETRQVFIWMLVDENRKYDNAAYKKVAILMPHNIKRA